MRHLLTIAALALSATPASAQWYEFEEVDPLTDVVTTTFATVSEDADAGLLIHKTCKVAPVVQFEEFDLSQAVFSGKTITVHYRVDERPMNAVDGYGYKGRIMIGRSDRILDDIMSANDRIVVRYSGAQGVSVTRVFDAPAVVDLKCAYTNGD